MPIKYCSQCGGQMTQLVPPDDDRPRPVCRDCGYVHYMNPKLVVGCVAEWKKQILLCRRSIEPQKGKWTVPAGYLEMGETAAEGAQREALEEACAKVEIIAPYTLLNLTFVNQIYLMFRANLIGGAYDVGHESMDVRLFEESEIPWDELAFTAVEKTLRHYFQDRCAGSYPFHMGEVSRG